MVEPKFPEEANGSHPAVRPLLSETEAKDRLTPKRKFLFGSRKSLQKIELLYLPYFWALVSTEFKGKRENLTVAADALEGVAVFPNEKFVTFESRHFEQPLPFLLNESQVTPLLLAAAKDFSLQVGIRQKQPLQVLGISSMHRVVYPFWVAYYTTPAGVHFTTLDAVSGAVQGVKMKPVFIRAFKILSKETNSG